MFFENPREWLDKPVKTNLKKIQDSRLDNSSWDKFNIYISNIALETNEKNHIAFIDKNFFRKIIKDQ